MLSTGAKQSALAIKHSAAAFSETGPVNEEAANPAGLFVLFLFYCLPLPSNWGETMPDLGQIRLEIERARKNVARLRRDLLALQKAGRPTAVTEADLQRLLDRVDLLCEQRDRLKALQPRPSASKVLGGRSW